MSSIVDKLIRFGEELTEMKSSAYDLWTWLPSHREAKKHHGDYACEFTPPIQTVMIEASIYIGPIQGESFGYGYDLHCCAAQSLLQPQSVGMTRIAQGIQGLNHNLFAGGQPEHKASFGFKIAAKGQSHRVAGQQGFAAPGGYAQADIGRRVLDRSQFLGQ